MGYNTPVDISNRSLQHCGIPPSNRITSLSENTKNAKECAFAYHKLRKAELRRNVWRFAIKHAVLRPYATTDKLYTPPTYSAVTTYGVGDIVAYTDTVDSTVRYWLSVAASNLANTPGSDATKWQDYFGPVIATAHDTAISYFSGELVHLSSVAYLSLITGNTDTPPSSNWKTLSGTLSTPQILYPIGSGPSTQIATRNVYRLPYGFLRQAPQDPKAGSASLLGAPSGIAYTDWLYEGDYIVSAQVDAIVLRFVADWSDVGTMDAMFCEGLAARLAFEICESVTQSGAKLRDIIGVYQKTMTDARSVNGIEVGAEEPPIDDYIACRA